MDSWITFGDTLIIPGLSDIESRKDIDTSINFLGLKLQIPIISANMDYVTGQDMAQAMYKAGGFGILHRFMEWDQQLKEFDLLDKDNVPFAFSVGIRDLGESYDRISDVVEQFPNAFAVCIDVAHGHHTKVAELVTKVKKSLSIKVIAGNVATREGAEFLRDAGADCIKVGIGAGAVCTTRNVAGVGVPQLSAILETSEVGIPIIADGGIQSSGDIAKALIAGASVVMLGSLLAGTNECPTPVVVGTDGRGYRRYRGQSIFGSNGDRYVKEGIEGYVEAKGSVEEILHDLQAGLRSSMSYVGARNIEQLHEKGKFVIVSQSTQQESSTRVRTII